MVHAENSDCIAWLTAELRRPGRPRPTTTRSRGRGQSSARARIAPSPSPRSWIPPSSSSTSRARRRSSRSAGRRGGGSGSSRRRAPSTWCSRPITSTRPASRARSLCAAPAPRRGEPGRGVDGAVDGSLPGRLLGSRRLPLRPSPGEEAPRCRRALAKIPNGIPGVETRLPLLFSEGVNKGRIDLPAFAALSATNAARLYGLYPRKGTIAVGSDADLAIWNPTREVPITNDLLHSPVRLHAVRGDGGQGVAGGRPLPGRGRRRRAGASRRARAGPLSPVRAPRARAPHPRPGVTGPGAVASARRPPPAHHRRPPRSAAGPAFAPMTPAAVASNDAAARLRPRRGGAVQRRGRPMRAGCARRAISCRARR